MQDFLHFLWNQFHYMLWQKHSAWIYSSRLQEQVNWIIDLEKVTDK